MSYLRHIFPFFQDFNISPCLFKLTSFNIHKNIDLQHPTWCLVSKQHPETVWTCKIGNIKKKLNKPYSKNWFSHQDSCGVEMRLSSHVAVSFIHFISYSYCSSGHTFYRFNFKALTQAWVFSHFNKNICSSLHYSSDFAFFFLKEKGMKS